MPNIRVKFKFYSEWENIHFYYTTNLNLLRGHEISLFLEYYFHSSTWNKLLSSVFTGLHKMKAFVHFLEFVETSSSKPKKLKKGVEFDPLFYTTVLSHKAHS